MTRRVVLASTVAALTLAGHASAHGMLPSTAGLLLAVVIGASLTLIATSRQRSWLWLLMFLLGCQVLLHALLVVASGQSHMTYGPMPLVPTGWMAVAHLVVTLIAAGVLARGDATLQAWAALLSASFGTRLVTLAPIDAGTGPVIARVRWWAKDFDPLGCTNRRGPPVLARG